MGKYSIPQILWACSGKLDYRIRVPLRALKTHTGLLG